MSLEALSEALEQWPIKALVMTARAGNPMGASMPEARQRELLGLAEQHGLQIIEDDIYGELMFESGESRALKAFDHSGVVMYCSSFSKTISPGVRVGWTIAGRHQGTVEKLQTFTTLSPCSVSQMAVAAYLENGGYDRHLRHIRQEYRQNLSAFQLAIQRYFPEGTQITRPRGGFILWVSLPGGVDTQVLFNQALEQGIAIAPGLVFSNSDQFNHCLRLNCGIPWGQAAEAAVMTLGMLAQRLMTKATQLEVPSEAVAAVADTAVA